MQMCKSFGGSLALLSHQKGEIRCFCLRIMCCLSWHLHRLGCWLLPSLAAAFCQDTQEGCRPPSICAMELIGLHRKVMASEPNLAALIIFRKEQFCQKIWPKKIFISWKILTQTQMGMMSPVQGADECRDLRLHFAVNIPGRPLCQEAQLPRVRGLVYHSGPFWAGYQRHPVLTPLSLRRLFAPSMPPAPGHYPRTERLQSCSWEDSGLVCRVPGPPPGEVKWQLFIFTVTSSNFSRIKVKCKPCSPWIQNSGLTDYQNLWVF